MKEARSPHPAIVFEERFLSAADVAKNGGTATAVTFANGVATLTTSASSTLRYKFYNKLRGVYSIRYKLKINSFRTDNNDPYLYDFRSGAGIGAAVIDDNGTKTISSSSGTIYVNGIATAGPLAVNTWYDIIITGTTITCTSSSELSVGAYSGLYGEQRANWSVEQIQIYKGTLTASEVRNLYNNKTFKELAPSATKYPILDVHAFTGSIVNRANSTAITNTNVTVVNKQMIFNGTTSALSVGTLAATGDITAVFVGRFDGWGENALQRIFDNANFILYISTGQITCSSNGSTLASSAASIVALGKKYCIIARRKADGKVSLYVGTKDTPMTISGSPDQNSGTPTAGTTMYMGNNATNTRTMKGAADRFWILSGIISNDEMEQIRTSMIEYL